MKKSIIIAALVFAIATPAAAKEPCETTIEYGRPQNGQTVQQTIPQLLRVYPGGYFEVTEPHDPERGPITIWPYGKCTEKEVQAAIVVKETQEKEVTAKLAAAVSERDRLLLEQIALLQQMVDLLMKILAARGQ